MGAFGGDTSIASGVNDSGQAVRYGGTAGHNGNHSFMYSGPSMQDLNSLVDASGTGYSIYDASGISDTGNICATAKIGGFDHAVLLTLNPVPKPMTMLAIGTGAVGVIRRRTRKS